MGPYRLCELPEASGPPPTSRKKHTAKPLGRAGGTPQPTFPSGDGTWTANPPQSRAAEEG